MQEQNIPVLDLNQAITPMIAKYQLPGNCHYRDDGYRFMGKWLAEKVMAELPSNPPKKTAKASDPAEVKGAAGNCSTVIRN